jgi:hypothetical protein
MVDNVFKMKRRQLTRPRIFKQVTATRLNLMSVEEMERLVNQATECSEGECSIDEVDDLLDVLKTQQKDLHDRVDQIRRMIKSLEIVNAKGNRDEVRDTVKAIMRIFAISDAASGNNFPYSGTATGYSGEVGDGPTTAYDALNPKPWKP